MLPCAPLRAARTRSNHPTTNQLNSVVISWPPSSSLPDSCAKQYPAYSKCSTAEDETALCYSCSKDMPANELFRPFALIATALLTIAVALMLRYSGVRLDKSISQHMSPNRPTYKLVGAASTVCALLMLLYFHYWFIPFYRLPPIAELTIAAGLLLQIIQAWIPDLDDTSRTTQVHRLSVYLMGTAIAAFLAVSALGFGAQPRGFLFGAVSALMVIHAALLHTHKTWWRYFLLHQFFFFAGFLLVIAATSYF